MNAAIGKSLLALGILALSCLGTGCTSPAAYRAALSERDNEIRALREERVKLKTERRDLMSEKGDLEARLLEANVKLMDQPKPKEASAPQQSFPELDRLGIAYGMRDGAMVISIPSSISFPSGGATLSKGGQAALLSVAKTLRGQYSNGTYYIEGHTDSDPIKKSKFASNRDLSLARALAVLTQLVEECGVPDEACIVVGHGQYSPVSAGKDKASKSKNRRVEIVVQP